MVKLTNSEIEPIRFEIDEFKRMVINEESYAYSFRNNEGQDVHLKMNKNFVYFFISDCGFTQFKMQEPESGEKLRRGDIMLFAYPFGDANLLVSSDVKDFELQVLAISLTKLHSFFGNNFGENPESVKEYLKSFRMSQSFAVKPVNPEVLVLFHQLLNHSISGLNEGLYLQGKVLEIISYYLQQPQQLTHLERQCPFITDHQEMKKIREARDLLINDLTSPLKLKDLTKAVGTNEFKLKVGFKSMYGTTVYAYFNNYRMEYARKLLTKNSHNVKDVSHKIGYANPSHFIAAYKKKFGITPKRHSKQV